MSTRKPLRAVVAALFVLVLGFVAGRSCRPEAPRETAPVDGTPSAQATVWTCSMHPQVRLPAPGKCPICFMDLIPATSGGDDEDVDSRVLRMSESAMALAEIETALVERRVVAHEVDMVGKIAFDETRVATITSWVSGRLDRLFVDYTGVSVRANDHLVEIYSPTLYSAQQELLQAIATAKKLEGSSLDVLRTTSDRTVVSAREKLRLYGISDDQILEITERGTPDRHVTIRAPIGGVVVHKNALEGMYVDEGSQIYTIADLSKVWVLLEAYESDLPWLRYGQDVEFAVQAYPGEKFHGRIAFIDPVLDDRTRTVKIRLNVDNSGGRLKPEMFVSATAQAVLTTHGRVVDEDLAGKWMCPMHPEVVADGPAECTECGMDLVAASELGFVAQPDQGGSLVIPHTAPLVTGKRGIVYVRLPDREKPTFEGREIALGPRAGEWYVVHDGVVEGERVVVKGNFKIDSELQIRARPSMMSPADASSAPDPEHETAVLSVPAEFKRRLGGVVDAYLALQRGLADDRDDQAAADAIVTVLDQVEMAGLDEAAHEAWMARLGPLRTSALKVAGARDIDARRVALSPLTQRLITVLETFGYQRAEGAVGIFHCPMALDGDGADWLQQADRTANPYYGSSMLRCGSRTSILQPER